MTTSPGPPASVPLAVLTRGGLPESLHRGAVCALDERGRLLASTGDPAWPVWLRSSAKPFQLVPALVLAAEAGLRLPVTEIAVAAASHGAEAAHLGAAGSLLERGGFTVADLRCGAHAPMDEASARTLVLEGTAPTALHNNCSGKHAAMLLACRLAGEPSGRYESPRHPHQRRILSYLSRVTDRSEREIGIAVDGCAVPVFRLPLAGLALGYARLPGTRLPSESPSEASARRRIAAAMTRAPWYVAGTGRLGTVLVETCGEGLVAKEGAEGVFAVSVPERVARRAGWERAFGLAVKVEDGSIRSRDAIVVEALRQLGVLRGEVLRRLEAFARPAVRNVRGDLVGTLETSFLLERA